MSTNPNYLPPWVSGTASVDAAGMPAGVGQGDYWLLKLRAKSLFRPDAHEGPDRLSRVRDLFGQMQRTAFDERGTFPEIDHVSIDQLAWYRTFRNGPRWGIYIREAAVARIADEIASGQRPSGPDSEAVAWTTLYLHEYAHFLFDVAARSLEEAVGTDVFDPYHTEVNHTGPWHHEAEAVCNAFAYRNVPGTGYRRNLRRFLSNGPPGYRDFVSYLSDDRFDAGVEVVLGQMLRGLKGQTCSGLRPLFDDASAARISPAMVPVYVVYEAPVAPFFSLITALGKIETNRTFDKELKRLPSEVQRAWTENVIPALHTDVNTAGFKRLRGDHNKFSVRVHGTYRVILRQEGGDRWTATDIDHRKDVYR